MATFTVNGSNTSVNFSYTAPTDTMQSIISDCAESLWIEEFDEEGNVTNPFANATNQEKLDVVSEFIKDSVVRKANQWKEFNAIEQARQNEKGTNYQL